MTDKRVLLDTEGASDLQGDSLKDTRPAPKSRVWVVALTLGLVGCLVVAALGVGGVFATDSAGGGGVGPSPSSPPSPNPPSPTPPSGDATKCEDRDSCLLIVDGFLQRQPRQSYFSDKTIGLLQTHGPPSFGGGDCKECLLPETCPFLPLRGQCRFDVYDNALAAIYLTKRGKLAEAKRILDAFIKLLYKPIDHSIWPLAAAYTDAAAGPDQTSGAGVAAGEVDTGNNAWVVMAFAHYAAEAGAQASCYADVSRALLAKLTSPENSCEDTLGGYKARSNSQYRSTEHHIDLYGAAKILGNEEVARVASGFVHQMYNKSKREHQGSTFVTGTGNELLCDPSIPENAIPIDTQVWGVLANVNEGNADHLQGSLDFVLQEAIKPIPLGHSKWKGLWTQDIDLIGNPKNNSFGKGNQLSGFRFSNWGNGIQWEVTASAILSLLKYKKNFQASHPLADLDNRIQLGRDSIKNLLSTYHSVPSSILGGNSTAWSTKNNHSAPYPGGSDTGLGWNYMRYPHLASTVWAGLLLMHQTNPQDELIDRANPFLPILPVPLSTDPPDAACLPAVDPTSPSCSAHKKCNDLGLRGNCCPGDTGQMLGCC